MKQVFWLAWRNLFRNPRRTAASLVTVALGASGLLIYQGFNSGIMNQYRENTIHGYYGNGQVFPANYYGSVKEKPWESWIENSDEVEAKLKSVVGVTEVFPRLTFYAFLVRNGINLGGRGEGIVPEKENLFFNQMNFISGTDLKSDDQIILGKGLAESLGVSPGDTITVLLQTVSGQMNGADLTVAGVFHMGQKSIDDSYFRISLRQAKSLLDTQKVEKFSLATTGVGEWEKVKSGINQLGLNLEPIAFEVLDKVYYQNSVDFLEAQFGFIRSIILIIVALGIFNTISVGLLERATEIGALRANGERKSRLWSILAFESALLGLFGGILGIVFAVVVDLVLLRKGIPMPPGPGITRQYLIFIEMQPLHFVQALALPLIAAVVSSLFPIKRLLDRSIPDLLRSV